MKLLFATRNAGKVAELAGFIEALGLPLEVVSLAELDLPDVVEDAPSFEGNAEKKAVASAAASGLPALADDSGLCVDALGGRPGVHSARYAPTDQERIEKLLAELEGLPPERRTAAFRCALCIALPNGRTKLEVGEVKGRIADAPRGRGGFGYDPIFLLPSGKTLAELSLEQKGLVSHRANAFRHLKPHLNALAQGALR